jgi:mono/diheme cytochrome c family protein
MTRFWTVARQAVLASALAMPSTLADSATSQDLSTGFTKFSEQGGPAIYANVCQGCHMADGKGAAGAGRYPSLAGNPKLEQAGYPVALVVHGQGAMPPVGQMMNDAQVAAVVNYVRTHFGNRFGGTVTEQDVAAARQ